MAIGVILVNQSVAMNPAGNNSLFNYTGIGLGGSEKQITQSGLIGTINYYVGISSRKEYVGFNASLIPPDSEINNAPDSSIYNYEEDEAIVIINNSSLIASANFAESPAEKRKDAVVYEVKPGDTPSSIADSFGITTNTMLWANNLDLSSATKIKPGDKLIILPVSGVRHVIKKGETIASITKKYSANKEEILAYNSLKESDKLEIDAILIIPDGKMPVPPAPARPKTTLAYISNNANKATAKGVYRYVTNDQYNSPNIEAKDSHPPVHGRLFPWGQCTYYVALRRYVPWNGDAKNWIKNAKAYGFKTGSNPQVGAIIATAENPRYGHVAYVEAVSEDGSKITISEMNFVGLGIKSVRVISATNPVIRGYIYDKE